MAKKAVVDPQKSFFDAVGTAVTNLHRDCGPLYFAMLARFDASEPNEWTLLVGSRPLAKDLLEGTKIVAKAVARELSSEFSKRIRKIGILREDDPFFVLLAGMFELRPIGRMNLERYNFNGVEIEKAVVFACMRDTRRLSRASPSERRPGKLVVTIEHRADVRKSGRQRK